MSSIRVSSDPFGRSIKKVLEYLQQTKSDLSFGYSDLPPLDEDYLAEAKRKVMMFRMSGGMVLESDADMAKSSILKELGDGGLIETTGYKEFRLTSEGRQTTVHF